MSEVALFLQRDGAGGDMRQVPTAVGMKGGSDRIGSDRVIIPAIDQICRFVTARIRGSHTSAFCRCHMMMANSTRYPVAPT